VRSEHFDVLRPLNFGLRNLRAPVDEATVHAALDAFDPDDARAVSNRLRREADLESAVAGLVALYRVVRDEYGQAPSDPVQELRVAGEYLASVDTMYRDRIRAESAVAAREAEVRFEQRTADSRQNLRHKLVKARASARRSREREQQMGLAVDALQGAITELERDAHEQRRARERLELRAEELRGALASEAQRGWLSRLLRRAGPH
jgi:hypothetical protein